MGKNFSKEQNTVCLLLFISFLAGIVGVYFNKVGGVRIGRYAIFAAIACVPLTFLYLRKLFEVLNIVLLASLSGLTIGAGVAFLGQWYVYENPSRMWLGPKWLLIGGILLTALYMSMKNPKEQASMAIDLPNKEFDSDRFKGLSQLEQLKEMEKTFADEAPFQPTKRTLLDPAGLAYCGIGLGVTILDIASTESFKERWIKIGITIAIVALGASFVFYMRRRTFLSIDKIRSEVDGYRQELLANVRKHIAELESSAGDGIPPPAESN